MNEKQVEQRCSRFAKLSGWLSYKFVSPSNRGVPDRVFMRNGVVFFVEFKAPGKNLTKLQAEVIRKFRHEKFDVFVIDCFKEFEALLGEQFEKKK